MSSSLVLVCIFVLAATAHSQVFFITAPDVFHYGRDETVSVNVLGSTASMTVDIYLQDYPTRSRTFSRKSVRVQPNNPVSTEVRVEPDNIGGDDTLLQAKRVYLVAESTRFKEEAVVLLSSNSHYVFVQTDKPLYPPRKKVNIRVYTMDHNMKPDRIPIYLDIKNPQGVIIDRQLNLQSDDGIINAHFTFPEIVIPGNWSVVASYGFRFQKQVSANIEVREYVLPTFSVKISAPEFVLPAASQLNGYVEAMHTYGKPVEGRAEILFGVVMADKLTVLQRVIGQLDMNGVFSFNLNMSTLTDLGANYQFPNLEGALLHVEATVTEVYTGKSQTSISRSTVFASSPYKIKFPRTSKYFKPALPYVLRMDSKFVNGKAAGNLAMSVSAVASLRNGESVSVSRYEGENRAITADEEGRAGFTLDIPHNTRSLTITVMTADPQLEPTEQARSSFTVTSYQSPSNSYMLVRTRSDSNVVRIGDILEAEVFITNFENVNSVNYMILARGKILTHKSKSRQAGIVTTLHIPVTVEMSPSVRVLVYYIHGNNEVVADSVWVDVVNQCRNNISLSLPEGDHRPGENAEITITGPPRSKVTLVAVDQAVYILNDRVSLTRESMFKRMEDFDLGCTPGGGLNSQGVFKDIGLTTINNAGLSIPIRLQEGCESAGDDRKKRSADDLLSDLQVCCRRGRRLHLASSLTARQCRIRAAHLEDATTQCVNTFFRCCKKLASREPETIEPEVSGERRQTDLMLFEDLFDLIDETNEIQTRTDFDDSWLFITRDIGEDGRYVQRVTFPGSITSWSLQAIGVSSDTGMCVLPLSNLTIFRDFFLQLDLPYSAINKEQIEVRATLYNYRDHRLAAFVSLESDDRVCYSARSGESTERIRLEIEPHKAKTVTWPIVPLTPGESIIKVKAVTSAGGDAVEKTLLILPEGVQRTATTTIVLDPRGELISRSGQNLAPTARDGKQFTNVELAYPEEYVEGSVKCFVSITGEVMGPVVEAVVSGEVLSDRFVRLPTGCGEQTMTKLGPLVSVAKYLKETNQISGTMEQDIYEYIRKGILREMMFRTSEGAFKILSSSEEPSIWLTAFVVRIFSQAREFSSLKNDPDNIICTAVNWMLPHQGQSGQFPYPYGSRRRSSSGGMGGDMGFTAYVLIGLHEARCPAEEAQRAMDRAVTYLEGHLSDIDSSYQAAIVAYALALVNSDSKQQANNVLRGMSQYDAVANHRYWTLPGTDDDDNIVARLMRWYRRTSSARQVEIAAYAALAQLANDDLSYAGPIIKWLITQRTEHGAFVSTQDTIVGLHALSEYNIQTRRNDLNLRCKITSSLAGSFSKDIEVTSVRAGQRQEVKVTQFVGGELFIDTRGEGVGQAQVEMVYNVHDVAAEVCRFNLTVSLEDPNIVAVPDHLPENQEGAGDQGSDGRMDHNIYDQSPDVSTLARSGASSYVIQIIPCVRYQGANDTGMAILDVGLFTGFEPVEEDLKKLVADNRFPVSRYEINDRNVVLYLDKVPRDTSLCPRFSAKRTHIVGMTHPVAISVYDYYEPSEKCTRFYHPMRYSPIVRKLCTAQECRCAEVKCSKCYGFGDYLEAPFSYVGLMMRACEKGIDYVLKVRVLEKRVDVAFETVVARVMEAVKNGTEEFQKGQNITLWKKADCPCPNFQPMKEYLVMASNGVRVENFRRERSFKYLLDAKSYVVEFLKKARYRNDQNSPEWRQAFALMKFKNAMKRRGCTH